MNFKIKSIRYRVSVYVSIIVISVILISTFLISYIYSEEINKQTIIITEQKMNIISKKLENNVEEIIKLQNSIQDDNVLQDLMNENPKTDLEKYKRKVEISELLRQYSYANISINSIFLFDKNKKILDPLYEIEPYNKIIEDFDLFNEFILSKKYSQFSIPSNFPTKLYSKFNEDKNTITYFSKYINENNFTDIGYLLINIKKDYLFKDIKKSCSEEFDFAMVLDEKSNVIVEFGELLDQSNTYVIKHSLDNYNEWTIIAGVLYESLNEKNKIISKFTILIGLFSIIIVVIFSGYVSKRITNPITLIVDSMSKLDKNELPLPINVKAKDELEILVDGFNKMISDVKNLIDEVKKEKDGASEYKIRNLELKLELLQSQINPHFIHNTLNVIKYQANIINAVEIQEMIESFNYLLRASMSINTDFIEIEEEIRCVRSFLNILEYRYDNKIELIVNIEEKIKKELILKLILQPIIENAAYHGIFAKDSNGKIEISIRSVSDRIIKVEVKDDGIGMSKEKVNEILSRIWDKVELETKTGFNNIGLANINERLKLYYGEECKLNVESEIDKGTSVSFQIPYNKKEEK